MDKPLFKLISRTVFFPKQGILAIGDLHIGYESMMKEQGILLDFDQLGDTKKEIENIIAGIKATSILKKIILLGDIKHSFKFQRDEIFRLRNFLNFLEKFVSKENIILIKGNHDTFTLRDYELKDFYTEDELAFIHGDRWFKELDEKKVKKIIMGHVHPALTIKDKSSIKKEKFKCFLIGKIKRKQIIVLPSFLPLIAGTEINEIYKEGSFQTILSRKQMQNFDAFVIGKNRIYNFGKFKTGRV